MTQAVLECNELTVRRGGALVLDKVSISLHAGRIIGIIGPNGAGKTTWMEAAAGRLAYSGGSIRVCGRSVIENILATRAVISMASVPTGPTLNISGWDYLNLVGAVEGYRPLTPIQAELANILGLGSSLDAAMKTYSHGTLKKLSVLASLNESAAIYIYDEIFNGLDIVALRAMKAFFRNIASSGSLVLVCSHFLQILFQWCDEVVLINRRQVAKHWDGPEIAAYGGDYEKFEADAIAYYEEA
ncbi:MAG TPA: ABC transporter ATP-binding protein [Parvularculaceae bacterium]|nr:ABC transporter ATP-binding protein [Parvularculaceae bacterium]